MRKSLIIILLSCLVVSFSQAQNSFKFGVLGGVSTFDVKPGDILAKNDQGENAVRVAFKEANYGMHFGIFVIAKSDFLFIKPQIQFNSQTVSYELEDLQSGDLEILDETYRDIDIPLQLGVNIGPVRLGLGPVGHIHIDSDTEFNSFDDINYEQEFKEMTIGYILGAGIDIWNFHADVGYEGNFSNLGTHMQFFGNEVKFDKSPARFLLTIGISF